ncbi:MAG: Na+/H+ antiporter NhaC [Rikenellaceae bacterium]
MITKKSPTLFQALLPILVLMGLIALNVFVSPDDTLGGANQLSLILASAVGMSIALYNGVAWQHILDRVVHTVSSATSSLLILFIIGILSGTWMLSGVVPTMIYYGLDIINPSFFLPAAIILSSIISVTIGSSWSTVATIGVALLGIGRALGFDDGVIAGAIISGAYFGDKVSPLSDTTNLASAIAKVPIFTHIKYMMQTTIPSFLVALALFILISLFGSTKTLGASQNEMQSVIDSYYNISPFLLLVPLTVVWMIAKRYPTVIVLLIGGLLGAVAALVAQPQIVAKLAGETSLTFEGAYTVITRAMYGTTTAQTGSSAVDSLLTTGGMAGMLNTVWLILSAMIFGGVLEAGHLLEKIVSTVSRKVKSPGMAVTTTSGACVLFNLTTGDQYMAIVVPGKMFAKLFTRLKLRPELLSRTLEDSGTVTSVLIPWNTCGATQAAILGVATLSYAPFAFFCYLSPLTTILFAWLKIKIKPLEENENEDTSID